MVFIFDDAGQVTVIDTVILGVLEKPMLTKVRGNSPKLRIRWNISGANDSRGSRIPTFTYLADLNTDTGALRVIAKPVGYPQRFKGTGTCAAQTGKPNLRNILRK